MKNTLAAMQVETRRLVLRLLKLERTAVRSYVKAVRRIRGRDTRSRLGQFLADHERHCFQLNKHAESLGTAPSNEASVMAARMVGRVVLGGAFSEKMVLRALLSNCRSIADAYEEALQRDGVPTLLHEILVRNSSDAHRQRHYLCSCLGLPDEGEAANKEDVTRHGPEPRILAPAQPIEQTTDV